MARVQAAFMLRGWGDMLNRTRPARRGSSQMGTLGDAVFETAMACCPCQTAPNCALSTRDFVDQQGFFVSGESRPPVSTEAACSFIHKYVL